MKPSPLLLLLSLLALAACRSDRDTAPAPVAAATAPQASQPAVPQISGENIVRFDLVREPEGIPVGTYAQSAPDSQDWTGPHPLTGEPAQWTEHVQPGGINLRTYSPPPLAIVIDGDTLEVSRFSETGQVTMGEFRVVRVEYQ